MNFCVCCGQVAMARDLSLDPVIAPKSEKESKTFVRVAAYEWTCATSHKPPSREKVFKWKGHFKQHHTHRSTFSDGVLIVRFSLCIFNELPICSVALMKSIRTRIKCPTRYDVTTEGNLAASAHNYHHVSVFGWNAFSLLPRASVPGIVIMTWNLFSLLRQVTIFSNETRVFSFVWKKSGSKEKCWKILLNQKVYLRFSWY